MNPEAQEYLNKIIAKELPELTKDNISFLRARRDYLTEEQKEKFSEVLEDKKSVKSKNK